MLRPATLLKRLRRAAKMTLLPNGGTLKDYMSDSSYTKLKSYCMDSLSWKESKFEQYAHMKPFFFSSVTKALASSGVRAPCCATWAG